MAPLPSMEVTMGGPIMDDEICKRLALVMAVNCVRNTVIEDYHAAGKITDPEMAAFNREVANKLYTFLRRAFGPAEDREQFLAIMAMFSPTDWDEPQLDEDLARKITLPPGLQRQVDALKEMARQQHDAPKPRKRPRH